LRRTLNSISGCAGADAATLVHDERRDHRHGRGEHAEDPGRPPQRASVHEREHEQEGHHGHQPGADGVQSQSGPGASYRTQYPRTDDQRKQTDRQVDQEQRPPVRAEQVDLE